MDLFDGKLVNLFYDNIFFLCCLNSVKLNKVHELRFFQPISQYGFARTLVETRTQFPLSPGIISIEDTILSSGYSASFKLPFPPDFSNKKEKEIYLSWNIPEKLKSKALSNDFVLSIQPFYPSSIDKSISEDDLISYINSFLDLPSKYKQIFTLPYTFIDHPIIEQILDTECSLVILSGFQNLFNNQRRLAETFISLRENLSPDIALYIPGPVSPSHYSFLIYSGIDFFDNSIAYYISQNGKFLLNDGTYKLTSHPNCYCPHCFNSPPDVFKHNELILKNSMSRIQFALGNGTLRNLVEKDVHNSVTLAATLRYYDKKYSISFQKRIPLASKSKVECIGEESLFRPEVMEYRKRIETRFKPVPSSKLILLLPCSARKPYSLSKSHMVFNRSVSRGGKGIFSILSELILTSPLSLVPRELEQTFPAKNYDIPVTGEWSTEEIDVTAKLLEKVLAKYPEDAIIINHTCGKSYSEIVKKATLSHNYEVYNTSLESPPTSYKSLENLSKILHKIRSETRFDEINKLSHYARRFQAIADYQYGPGTGKILFPSGIKVKGKYPRNLNVFYDKKQVATFRTAEGLLSISPEHAQLIVEHSLVKLEFGAEKIVGSSIFAPGVLKADNTILPKDEVLIIHAGEVIGTAISLVSGVDMNKMSSGSVAKVKKKRKV